MDNIITTLRRIKIKTIGAIGRIRRKLNKIQNFMSPIKFSRFYILWFFIKLFFYIRMQTVSMLLLILHYFFLLLSDWLRLIGTIRIFFISILISLLISIFISIHNFLGAQSKNIHNFLAAQIKKIENFLGVQIKKIQKVLRGIRKIMKILLHFMRSFHFWQFYLLWLVLH
jgi:hypothetical protein